jgi:hypothetical protein
MAVSGINLKFEEQDYQNVFAEIDEDGNGLVDKYEAIELIKRIKTLTVSSDTRKGLVSPGTEKIETEEAITPAKKIQTKETFRNRRLKRKEPLNTGDIF